ncbi:MAG TPA: PspC domain-containing protein [Actinomycetota bacterium]|nr:PspC domain-containing protein [Actinomycetota bacterium]
MDERPELRRSRTDRILGGVAAGIAHYFGIDPVLVRLSLVLLTIAGGSGVLLYLIAWLIIPEETEGEVRAPARSAGLDAATTRLLLGGALIAIGGIMLASRFIPYFSRVFWPLAFIVAGAAVIMGAAKR